LKIENSVIYSPSILLWFTIFFEEFPEAAVFHITKVDINLYYEGLKKKKVTATLCNSFSLFLAKNT